MLHFHYIIEMLNVINRTDKLYRYVLGIAMRHIFALIALGPTLGACALDPFHIDDPRSMLGVGPKVSDVMRSMRCELVTFLVANRLRSALITAERQKMDAASAAYNRPAFDAAVEIQKRFKFLEIDSTQFAGVVADFKNIDTLNLTLGYDWKQSADSMLHKGDSHDWHTGPGYSDTRTFELIQNFALPQKADFGPTGIPNNVPGPLAVSSGIYLPGFEQDKEFYCFSSLSEFRPKSLLAEVTQIDGLASDNELAKANEHFRRIFISGSTTPLAQWLQELTTEIEENHSTIKPTAENILPGQLEYTFTLDAKPSLDAKYTLVAGLTNPLVPDINGSIEHSSQFTVYLNTPYAAFSFGSRQGNTCDPTNPDARYINQSCKVLPTKNPGSPHTRRSGT